MNQDREQRIQDGVAIAHRPSVARRILLALRPTPRTALGFAAVMSAGILVAAGLAAGSYAFLNSQATTSAVTITSGNLALTVQYGGGTAGATATIPTTAWAAMLPGDVVGQQFTMASTGTATSNLTARLSATSAWEIRVAPGTCPATQLAASPLTTTAIAISTLAGGATSSVCVQATLPAAAVSGISGTSAAFSIVLGSTQVPS